MTGNDDEERRLRAAALQNAQAVLLAREQADREIAAERERLRITLASIGDGVISADTDGRVTFLNGVAEKLTGWPRDEAAGRPLTEVFRIVNEYTRGPVENPALRAIREGVAVGLANHTVLVARDGTERPIDDSAAPMRDEDGKPVGAVLVFRDVTERKRADEARARLAAIVESSDDAIVSKTLDGVIRSWNRGAERIFGYARDEAVGRHITLIIPPDRLDEERMILDRIGRGERVDHYETVRVGKGGRPVDISLTVSPVRDPAGRIIGASKIARDISDRRRAEERVRESEGRYRAIVEATPECVKLVAPDGTLLQMNPAGLAMVEADESAIGGSVYDVIAEEHRGAFREFNERVCRGERGTLAFDVVGRRGTRRHMETTAVPLPAPAGGFNQLAVTRDVTDQRRAEERLRRSEAEFRHMADSMPQIVWAARPDGFIDYYNERWYEFTGFPRGVFGDGSWKPILHPDDVARCVETYYGCVRTGGLFQIEYRFRDRRTGGYRWFLGRADPVRDERGEVTRWFGTCTDIDDTKRAEETTRFLADASAALAELTDYESTLQKVAALAVPFFADWCAVDMLDAGGSVRRLAVAHADPGRVALAGELFRRYPPGPADPRGLMRVLRTGEPEWAAVITDEMLEESARDAEQLRLVRELGLKSYICVPLRSRGGALGAITFATAESGRIYDANALRAAEDLAHRAVIAVQNANLLTALKESDRRKDEFLALLAHELRNPLAPIRNGLQVIRLSDSREVRTRSQEMMDRQLSHMVRLVDDLLDVSRITRGKMELRRAPVRLADVIGSAVETARPAIDGSGHDLEVSLPPEPVVLDADLTRLAQVVGNLLSNSAKYTPPGGHIRLSAERRGDAVEVVVRDDGLGIPARALPTIFDMFSQVDRSLERTTGGLGIGLALVKGLVEMHGGTVSAASDGPGRGSAFTVRLPVAPPPPETAAEPPARAAGAGPGRRVLVVDDNRDAAESMAMMLELLGDEVWTAHDGLEAVRAADEFRPQVILMDVGMPRLNGYEATRRIRELPWGKSAVIVALTGWGQEGDRAQSREAGCDAHLVKPVNLADLQKVVAELTGRGGEGGA